MGDTDAAQLASAWVEVFGAALAAPEPAAAAELLCQDGHWRDLLALDWRIATFSGRDAIGAMLRDRLAHARIHGLRLASGRTPPRRVRRAGMEVIEALLEFETAHGTGAGVVRLVPDGDRPRAVVVTTTLEMLGDPAARRNPDFTREFGGENWLDKRHRTAAFAGSEPEVVVLGAGQAGLSIAAWLGALGVATLVIDRQARIGDNWRKRYHALTLHNEVHVNHLPFMPFPPTWPVFIPKDKLANWFEAYAESMELNVWTRTELVGGAYDEAKERWALRLRGADGTERTVCPAHLIYATGVSSIPVKPALPGLGDFGGTVLHSGAYTEGSAWRGKRALVLGTGNSGHDVAQDLQASGAAVTMIQRSPTYIVSLKEAQSVYSIYNEGPSVADCDLLATAIPYPLLVRAYQLSTAAAREKDRSLLDALTERGFKLDFGDDDTGFQMKYLRRGGGYYFNVGCSDLVADGTIGLVQWDAVERFVPEGVRLRDGTVKPAELLVLATGYKNQQDTVRATLGDAVADRVGPVWGFDEGRELRNMWRPTAQPGLWFTAGSLAQCRIYSRYLAIQIKARLDGLLPPSAAAAC